jgi:FtsH-binding integral membrane protein
MRRLTESAVGLWLVLLALACAATGIAANMADFTEPETWFLTGLVLGILAIAVAVDEQRLSNLPVIHPAEEWLARSVMGLSFVCGLAGFVLGIFVDDDNRNLWSVMAVILALLAVSVTIDAHRVVVARHSHIDTRHDRDALAGVICAAIAVGVGIFGLFTGIFGLPHAEAWLFGGVVFAVISAAFMFDEQVHTVHKARRTRRAPFASTRPSD